MRKLVWLAGISLTMLGCSGGESGDPVKGDTAVNGPKLSREQAAQYANILPGRKGNEDK